MFKKHLRAKTAVHEILKYGCFHANMKRKLPVALCSLPKGARTYSYLSRPSESSCMRGSFHSPTTFGPP